MTCSTPLDIPPVPETPSDHDNRRARLEKLSMLAMAALLDHYANVAMRDIDRVIGEHAELLGGG